MVRKLSLISRRALLAGSAGLMGAAAVVSGIVRARRTRRPVTFAIQAPIPVEEFWAVRWEMSEKLREKFAMLSAEQFTEVKRLSLESLREYSTDSGMSFPAQVLIVSGTKKPGPR